MYIYIYGMNGYNIYITHLADANPYFSGRLFEGRLKGHQGEGQYAEDRGEGQGTPQHQAWALFFDRSSYGVKT